MNIQGIGGPALLYGAAKKPAFQAAFAAPIAAADKLSISQAARDRLASEEHAGTQSAVGLYDTDKGSVSLDLDDYFSARPRSSQAEIPPLLMPSQQNIDALSKHISAVFPKFLSEHGIPSAPSSISYDSQGQPQFPADYPYADQLSKALQDSPGLSREISTAHALTSAKRALDQAVKFQQEYRQATTQKEIEAVVSKYSYLFSEKQNFQELILKFSADGTLSIPPSDSSS